MGFSPLRRSQPNHLPAIYRPSLEKRMSRAEITGGNGVFKVRRCYVTLAKLKSSVAAKVEEGWRPATGSSGS